MTTQTNTYYTLGHDSMAEFSDRGSKFIAYAYEVDIVDIIKLTIKKLKEQHPKAVHVCFAYRIGFDQLQFRASDDGEPSGSAGKPILGQIDSAQLKNVLIAVVRYFGGVLLGVPGLINAYKTAAHLAITEATIVEKSRMQFFTLQFDYTQMNDVMRVLKMHQCQTIHQSLLLFCEMKVGVSFVEKDKVIKKLQDIQGVLLQVEV
jgi:uncharacterized YigZ family protein